MLSVGMIFQSEKALEFCLSSAEFNRLTREVEIDKKLLIPNVVSNPNVGSKVSVRGPRGEVGKFDLRNNSPQRKNSLWIIESVRVDPSGCGDSHNISGKSTSWARYFAIAKRINADSSDHASGERLNFSSSGYNIVKDFKRVSLS